MRLEKFWNVKGLTPAVALMAVALAGCASTPKTPPPVAAVPTPPAPPPHPYTPPPPAYVQQGPLPGSVKDFVVNVGDRVYFDLNAASIRTDASAVLAAQAAWLNHYPGVQVRIEGNCDERGTEDYNLALGARRANAVKEFLVAHAVSVARITTVSYGKEHPIDTGTGEDAWAHNRNAHTDITEGAK